MDEKNLTADKAILIATYLLIILALITIILALFVYPPKDNNYNGIIVLAIMIPLTICAIWFAFPWRKTTKSH